MTDARAAASAEGPRYRAIVRSLLNDIDAGHYAVGDRLPTEVELCDRFDVSRYTVREALRRLQVQGVISRRQGAGSVVTPRPAASHFVNSIDSIDGLMQYASTTQLDVISVEKVIVEGEQAKRLLCPPNSAWVRIAALRHADDLAQPICYTDLYISPAFADVVAHVGQERTAVHAMIERQYGVNVQDVLQDIEAAEADLNLATRLGIKVGAPVLIVRRRYFDDLGNLIEFAMNAHPADRFRYEMTLQRRSGNDTA